MKSYQNKKECEEELDQNRIENPDFPQIKKLKPLAVTDKQIKEWILDKYSDPPIEKVESPAESDILSAAYEKISSPHLSLRCKNCIENTLNYMFYKMKTGIYVSIRDGKVASFILFANKDFRNDWHKFITFPPGVSSVREYMKARKFAIGYTDNMDLDISKWSANGGLIGAEMNSEVWGDGNVGCLHHMLSTVCADHDIPDIDFFINKRDCPYLKKDLTEPYHHIVNSRTMPLLSHKYDSYAPILGYSTTPDNLDIPIPVNDDWQLATKLVFQPGCNDSHINVHAIKRTPWKDRKTLAFFRGGATGPGTTPQTNQRLKVAQLSKQWKNNGDHILDGGITSWNARDKTKIGGPLTFIQPRKLPFKKAGRVPMQEWENYKYIIYIDGHSAAYRMSTQLFLGCLTLMVESPDHYDLWYYHLLQPFVHYVPVSADLSDLREKIQWCVDNDDKAEQIAKNAFDFYNQHLTKESMTKYLRDIMVRLKEKLYD